MCDQWGTEGWMGVLSLFTVLQEGKKKDRNDEQVSDKGAGTKLIRWLDRAGHVERSERE